MSNVIRFCCGLLPLVLLLSCTPSGQQTKGQGQVLQKARPSNLITAVSSGELSRFDNIRVVFAKPVPAAVPSEKADPNANLFLTFQPAIQGKAYWRTSTILEFVPDQPLDSGQSFAAYVDMHRLYPEVQRQEKQQPDFKFYTPRRALTIHIGAAASHDQDMRSAQIEGHIETSDREQDVAIESLLTAMQGNQALPIQWRHQKNQHRFTIDGIKRTENASSVTLNWDGKLIDVPDFEGSRNVAVPGRSQFRFLEARVEQQPNYQIVFSFSDPLKRDQDMRGLISVPNANLGMRVDGSQIIVRPHSSLSGDVIFTVHRGIRNSAGYALGSDATYTLTIDALKPELRLVDNKSIVTDQSMMLLPFEAVNIKAVDVRVIKVYSNNLKQFFQSGDHNKTYGLNLVGKPILYRKVLLDPDQKLNLEQWNRHVLDLSELVQTDPAAIYNITLAFRQDYALYGCSQSSDDDGEDENPYAPEPELWDYYESYRPYSWYNRENPCHSAYYNGNRNMVSTNLYASNMGLIAKYSQDAGNLLVVVNNIQSTQPLSSTKVTVYDQVHQALANGITDQHGMVYFQDLPEGAHLIHAQRDESEGYLTLKPGESLSMSRFDTGGSQTNHGVSGYLFGERGVWRPGDDIYLTFILRDAKQELPAEHPVVLEFRDPRGRLLSRQVKREAIGNFYSFDLKTDDDAITGPYRATVWVGGARFDKVVRVETVRPNRLKMQLDLPQTRMAAGQEQQASLQVNWLHGAPLKQGKVQVRMQIQPGATRFENYPQVQFDDPSRRVASGYDSIFDGTTNADGSVNFSFKPDPYNQAPGRLRALFEIKAFEPSGAFSTDIENAEIDPFPVYVGMRLPERDADWNVLHSDDSHQIEVYSVNADGTPAANQEVEVALYRLGWRWWWDREDGRSALYQARTSATPALRTTLTTDAQGRATWQLSMPVDSWGRYFLRTSHKQGHASGETFYMYRRGWSMPADADAEGASMLTLKSDNQNVNVGDIVKVTVPSSPNAKLLLSLERGDQVLTTRWIDSQSASTEVTFQATAEMVPTVYAHVTMLQPTSELENDYPIRMYGVLPITVEDAATRLKPELELPDVLEPELSVTLKVSESEGRAMTYTLAMVDEGLLDLTRFKTPDPHSYFYAKQALTLQTYDLYNHVQGAFGDQFQALLAIGGGGSGDSNENQKAKRFPPMVQFLGPFQLKAGEQAEHQIQMPAYIGSVRTMLIAGADDAYGITQKTTPVRKPLMVLAGLPRVLTPNETLDVPITLFAMEPGLGEVTVEVKSNDRIQVLQGMQTTRFDTPGEATLRFPISVSERLGIGTFQITATAGQHSASYSVEIDVRSPNPVTTETQDFIVTPGSRQVMAYEPLGLYGAREGWIEVSALPPMNLAQRLDDLIRYPYGCIEQTTSSVFPQLRLTQLRELDDQRMREVAQNISKGIQRIASFQLYNGGLSYWPGDTEVSAWGSLYAGHFMLAAQEGGYQLPPDFLQRWISYQSLQARSWISQQEPRYQAYRLYLLALADKPEVGAMNRFRDVENLGNTERWLLAAAYQLAGQADFARQSASGLSVAVSDYTELGGSYGSTLRDQAIILQCMVHLGLEERAANLAVTVAERLNNAAWLSTQSAGFALIAMAAYADMGQHKLDFSVAFDPDQRFDQQTNKPLATIPLPDSESTWADLQLSNRGERRLFVKLVRRGIPGTEAVASGQKNLEQSVVYKDAKGNTLDPSQLPQGRDFYVEVTVRNLNQGRTLHELALAHLVPSGWEIHNTRLQGDQAQGFDTGEYQDYRDDRVYTFFDLRPQQSKTFRIGVNAAFQGRFYLPSIRTQAMYDNDIYAQQASGWVRVVPSL